MSDDLFAILVWALLYATIFAPLVFRKVLGSYMLKLNNGKPQAVQKPALAHSATGHLPVLLCAEHDRDSKLQQRVKELELSLESKAVEIAQLKAANQASTGLELSVAEAYEAEAANVAPLTDADRQLSVQFSCRVAYLS